MVNKKEMAKRKFSGERLYKLLKILVIIISSYCLMYGVSGFVNWNKTEWELFNKFEECKITFKSDYPVYCQFWLSEITLQQNVIMKFTAIGILLPILFFGGTRLFRYLFPEIKKEKNESE